MESIKDWRKGKKTRLRLSAPRKSRTKIMRRWTKINKENASFLSESCFQDSQDHYVYDSSKSDSGESFALDAQVVSVKAQIHNEIVIDTRDRFPIDKENDMNVTNKIRQNEIDYDAITPYDLDSVAESSTPHLDKENDMNVTNKIRQNEIDYDAITPYDLDSVAESSTPHLNEMSSAESYNKSSNTSESNMAIEIDNYTYVDNAVLEGNRVVDIGYFFEQLKNINHDPFTCHVSELEFIKEIRIGFYSTLYFKCKMCNKREIIYSQRGDKNNINTNVVQGISQTGNGYAQLNELCASFNLPNMSEKYFIKNNKYLYTIQKDIAIAHMLQAGAEEKKLAIENKEIDSDGIPYITVVTDGSWAKRSYGTNYNSLSGVGCIIGHRTRKILFIGVRNSYCCVCAIATNAKNEIPPHKCFKNWFRQSTEMETDAILEGFKLSIQMHGLKYTRLIGDGDSSVTNALRDNMPYGPNTHIRKIECSNHLLRNYTNKLRRLAKKTENKVGSVPSTLRKSLFDKIRRLRNAVTGAIEHSRQLNVPMEEKIRNLKEDLRNGPCHVFGSHSTCKAYYCKNRNAEESLVSQLKTCGMWTDIYEHIGYLLQHTESLLLLENNNPAEQFNSIIAKFLAGKRVNFALRGTYESRCYNAVTAYNTKDYSLLSKVQQKVSRGKQYTFTNKYIEMMYKKLKSQRKRSVSDKIRGAKRAKRSRVSDKGYGEILCEPDLPQAEFEQKQNDFLQALKMSPSDIKNLERITVTQTNSDRWIVERKKRITASLFGQICKMRNTTPCISTVKMMLYSAFTGNDATRYGKAHEASAISDFQKKTNLFVSLVGYLSMKICRISEHLQMVSLTPIASLR